MVINTISLSNLFTLYKSFGVVLYNNVLVSAPMNSV